MFPVSIVIPLYNKKAHIKRTLDSVISQEMTNFELIVIDDGSTDGSGEIVKDYNDPRITLISQENKGVSKARNLGILKAQGNLIAFLDADDEWKPQFLREILKLQELFPSAGAYATAYEQITPQGSLRMCPPKNILEGGTEYGVLSNYFKVGLHYPVCASAVAIPKNILEEIGGFPADICPCEDLAVFLKVALNYQIAWTYKPLAIYYQDATNRRYGFIRFVEEPPVSKIARQAIQSGSLTLTEEKDLKEYAAMLQVIAARDCLLVGRREVALRLLNYSKGTKLFGQQWWKLRLGAALPGNLAQRLWRIKQALLQVFKVQ